MNAVIKLNIRNILVFIMISACFSGAVYRINQNAVQKVAAAQAAARQAGQKVALNCHYDIGAINKVHDAVREQISIQIQTTREALHATEKAYQGKFGPIPDALKPVYKKAIERDRAQIIKETHLRSTIHDLKPIC